jgi:hypothetical protein
VESKGNYHNISSQNTTTATSITKMPGTHAKSHVFNTHKRKVKKRGRDAPRIMSMASLVTRLNQVHENKVTMIAGDVNTGQEVRAKITSASITVMHPIEMVAGLLDIVPDGPAEEADTVVSDPLICDMGGTVDMCADSDETAEESIQLDKPSAGSESTNCSELEHIVDGDCMASDEGITKASKYDRQSSNPRCTRVGLPPHSVVPLPGTALRILGTPTLPPAFLPTYTNEIKIATTEPIDPLHVPAYQHRSTSSSFRGTMNPSVYGTSIGLTPAGAASSTADSRSDPWAAPRFKRSSHIQLHATTRIGNANEVTWQEMPEVPKEGPTPHVLKTKLHPYIGKTEKNQSGKEQTPKDQEVKPQARKYRASKSKALKPLLSKAVRDKDIKSKASA